MTPRLRITLGAGLLIAGAATLFAGAPQAPAGWAGFTRVYHDALTQHAIVGSSIALIKDGRIIARGDFDLRDRAGNRPVDDSTIFHSA